MEEKKKKEEEEEKKNKRRRRRRVGEEIGGGKGEEEEEEEEEVLNTFVTRFWSFICHINTLRVKINSALLFILTVYKNCVFVRPRLKKTPWTAKDC